MAMRFHPLPGLVHKLIEPMEHGNKKDDFVVRMPLKLLAKRSYGFFIGPPAFLVNPPSGFGQFDKDFLVISGFFISSDDFLGFELFYNLGDRAFGNTGSPCKIGYIHIGVVSDPVKHVALGMVQTITRGM